MNTRSQCISVDLDGYRCYAAIHGLPDATTDVDPILATALPRMLEIFDDIDLRATLFCVGRDLAEPQVGNLLAAAHGAGHELASHSFSHFYDLRSRDRGTITDEIVRCEQAIEALSGDRPRGFRTPGYNIGPSIAGVLAERGYLYDSSILPCPSYYAAKGTVMGLLKLRGRPSRSQMALPQTLSAPIRPYRASAAHPWRRGKDLWQIPMAVVPGVRLPVIGTTLTLMGPRIASVLMPVLRLAHPRLLNLELHAIDFVDHSDSPALSALSAQQIDLRTSAARKIGTLRTVFRELARGGTFRTLASALDHL